MILRRVFLDIFLWVFLKSQNGFVLIVCAVNKNMVAKKALHIIVIFSQDMDQQGHMTQPYLQHTATQWLLQSTTGWAYLDSSILGIAG